MLQLVYDQAGDFYFNNRASVSVEELSAHSCLVEISFAGRKLVDLDWRKLDRMEILASENAKLHKKRDKG